MKNNINRRDLIKAAGLTAAGLALSPFMQTRAWAETGIAASGPRKRVLFFTKSQTFQHSVITRPEGSPEKLSFAEQLLTEWGNQNELEIVCSKDGSLFTPENIATFDAFAFCTTGDLTQDSDKYATKPGSKKKPVPDHEKLLHKEPGMPPGGKEAFLDAIKNGKGFIGFHCAADTFHSKGHVRGKVDLIRDVDAEGHDAFDPYIQMLGGEFIIHGKQQKAILKTIDPKFPGAEGFNNASFVEEWYSLKNFQPDLHVILAQDCTGMDGPMYARGMYPETWARMHGNGRVFYTSMGHREDVWQKPEFKALVVGALNWTIGRIDVDIPANVKEATPDANVKKSA